jgi:hypothetical protein
MCVGHCSLYRRRGAVAVGSDAAFWSKAPATQPTKPVTPLATNTNEATLLKQHSRKESDALLQRMAAYYAPMATLESEYETRLEAIESKLIHQSARRQASYMIRGSSLWPRVSLASSTQVRIPPSFHATVNTKCIRVQLRGRVVVVCFLIVKSTF